MIKIATRFHPFSHLAGASCLLPKSTWKLQAFPTLLIFTNLHTQASLHVHLHLDGPVENFTLEQDLERGEVHLFGQSVKGYFRLRILRTEKGIEILFERTPSEGIACSIPELKKQVRMQNKQQLLLSLDKEHPLPEAPQERLSLGMHKAQDWDLVCRRLEMTEVLPVWMRLAGFIPEIADDPRTDGTLQLLQQCEEILASDKKTEIIPALKRAFLAGFSGILVPRLEDDQFQGIVPTGLKIPTNLSPLLLLKRGKELIRSLFFQEKEGKISLLPHLPPELFAGRFTGIKRENGDQIDLEWSKKLLRRVIFRSAETQTLNLVLQKSIRRFRLRHDERKRGLTIQHGDQITLQAGEKVYLDRFEK